MSRILFPDTLPLPSTSSSQNPNSFKAPYRPGKIPGASNNAPRPSMKRNDSVSSLPSPPSERKLRRAGSLLVGGGRGMQDMSDEEDVDGDTDVSGGEEDVEMLPAASQGMGLGLGRPLILNGRNPFLNTQSQPPPPPPPPSQSYDLDLGAGDNPLQSPTQVARRNRKKNDIDRISLFTPKRTPRKEEEVEEEKKVMKDGWDDPNNPFLVKKGDTLRPPKSKAKGKMPEKMVYVFRGKKITYDVPFSALIAPDTSDSSSPFPNPSPRLLFPQPPTTPPTSEAKPTPSFLDALKGSLKSPKKGGGFAGGFGLPTPARESKREREVESDDERGLKKWRGEDVEMAL